MQDVFKQIDAMFSDEYDRPNWANELFDEIKSLKTIIKEQTQTIVHTQPKPEHNKPHNFDLYDFVKRFREQMKPDVANDIYPSFQYNNTNYGINNKGYIYNQDTSSSVSRDEAFKIYRYMYENQNNINVA